MTKFMLLAAAAASLAAGGAQAHEGEYLPAPAYAGSGYDYTAVECGGHHGFTLAGARAGVTVLGVDLDAHAGLNIGVHGGGACGYGGYGYRPRPVQYAPQPYAEAPPFAQPQYVQPQPYGYAQTMAEPYAPPMYAQPMYPQPTYAPQPAYAEGGYGRAYDVPCGCGW